MNKENKNIVLLIIRGNTTQFGNIIYDYANKILIAGLRSKSLFYMMIYQSSESIIQMLLNLYTGHFADSNNRKQILIVTDLIAGIVTFVLFLFYNPSNIWGFIIVNIILAILFCFNRPTHKAIVRDLLSTDGIYRFNSISKILSEVISISAPLFSMIIIKELGFKYGMLINSVSFFVSALCEYNFQVINISKKSNSSFMHGIFEGIKYVVSNKTLFAILVTSAFLNFLDAIYSFYLPYTSSFSGNENLYGCILVSQAIGSMCGALIIGPKINTLNLSRIFHFLLPGAIVLILMGIVSDHTLLVLIFFGVFSASVTMFNVCLMSHIQTSVDPKYLGRVFSIIFTISGVFVPFGSFVASIIDMKNWLIFQCLGISQFIIYMFAISFFSIFIKKNYE